jgi:hypothetical protein
MISYYISTHPYTSRQVGTGSPWRGSVETISLNSTQDRKKSANKSQLSPFGRGVGVGQLKKPFIG